MRRLDGKVALVSGGRGGLGSAIAAAFRVEGARVLCGDLDAQGDDPHDMPLDVTDEASWTDAVTAIVERFGRLDVLVNNAGILRVAPMVMTTAEEFMRTVEVNQLGVFMGMKAVAPVMVAAGQGSIINISSVAGMIGSPLHAAYAASKWAVRGMTKVAAVELAGAGVRVNSIHPGLVDTPMLQSYRDLGFDPQTFAGSIPLGRLATVDDVTPLAVYLASDESRYATGAEFIVDGGFSTGPAPRAT